jgi:hypothetical protein
MCTRDGNQQSRGVVTARVQTDVVQSIRHQHRDLHQSTYPVLLRRLGLILLSQGNYRKSITPCAPPFHSLPYSLAIVLMLVGSTTLLLPCASPLLSHTLNPQIPSLALDPHPPLLPPSLRATIS